MHCLISLELQHCCREVLFHSDPQSFVCPFFLLSGNIPLFSLSLVFWDFMIMCFGCIFSCWCWVASFQCKDLNILVLRKVLEFLFFFIISFPHILYTFCKCIIRATILILFLKIFSLLFYNFLSSVFLFFLIRLPYIYVPHTLPFSSVFVGSYPQIWAWGDHWMSIYSYKWDIVNLCT